MRGFIGDWGRVVMKLAACVAILASGVLFAEITPGETASGPSPSMAVATPTPHVFLSRGPNVTIQDLSQFRARWMTDDLRQQALQGLQGSLLYRDASASWTRGPYLASLGHMYELTKDTRYLDDLRDQLAVLLDNRDDFYPGNPDTAHCLHCGPKPVDQFRGNKPLPGWGSCGITTGGKNTVDEDASNMYAFAMALFARIVAEDPSLHATYGQDAMKYSNAALQTVWMLMPQLKYEKRGDFYWAYLVGVDLRESPVGCHAGAAGCTPAKLTRQDCDNEYNLESAGVTAPDSVARLKQQRSNCYGTIIPPGPFPYNESGLFVMTLVELWRALDTDFYKTSPLRSNDAEPTRVLAPVVVARFHRYWHDHTTAKADNRGERAHWNYMDNPNFNSHSENTPHGAVDMLYLDLLRRNFERLNAQATARGEPIPLDQAWLRRFANTFLQMIATGQDFKDDIDSNPVKPPGAPDNSACTGWGYLAAADPSVYRICREITLRVVDGQQVNLTMDGHVALLMNKQFSREMTFRKLAVPTTSFKAAGDPFVYFFESQGVQNAVFRGTDGRVHGRWRTAQGAVGDDNLSQLGHAPNIIGDPKAYVFAAQGIQNVVYHGVDGHLHGLYWSTGAVGHDDLTALSHAPGPAGDPYGYVIPWQGVQNVVYRGIDGHLHGLYWSTGAVGHDDLTALSHAPAPLGKPFGYVVPAQQLQKVIYRGVDGHLYRLSWNAGAVRREDLNAVAHAPYPKEDATAYVTPESVEYVVYRGVDGHIHELYPNNGAVGHDDLSAAATAATPDGNPAGYFASANGTHHVIYHGLDQHLHELWWTTGSISHTDLTDIARAPLPAGDPSTYFSASNGTHHVVYRGQDGNLYEIYWTK